MFWTSQLPKALWTWCVLYILTLRHVLRATTACIFWTSQLAKVLCALCAFYILTSECASHHNGVCIFNISTSKSAPDMRCTFWLRHVIRAVMARAFAASQLPKALRMWGVFRFFPSKRASLHSGAQFFISHLARCLRTRRFSEPTFRPSGTLNHWKNTVNRDFPTFSRTCISFLLTLSPSLLRLCLSICPYCRKFDF